MSKNRFKLKNKKIIKLKQKISKNQKIFLIKMNKNIN